MLHMQFRDTVRVENHARNGRSTKSFIAGGGWNKVSDPRVRSGVVELEDKVPALAAHLDRSPKKTKPSTPAVR